MIIGDDFLKIAFQIEFIISDYSSPSGMFNFIINEKLNLLELISLAINPQIQ